MRKQEKKNNSTITGVKPYVGERLEKFVQRCTAENVPIENTAPLRYTERDLGVVADFNHRADKWELMQQQATDTAISTRVMMNPKKYPDKYKELTGNEPPTE